MKKQKPALNNKDAQIASRALEVLFTTQYVSRRQLYKENFLRGMFFSAGTIIGAAIIVALTAWLLSLFNEVPIIGPAVNTVQQSIEKSQQ